MRHDHKSMRAAAGGGFIMILRNEFRDGLGEFAVENREAMRTTSMMGSNGDKNDRRCRVVGVRWKPAILSATTSGIETWWRNHDFIQETGWIMCGFGIDGGHVVGIGDCPSFAGSAEQNEIVRVS